MLDHGLSRHRRRRGGGGGVRVARSPPGSTAISRSPCCRPARELLAVMDRRGTLLARYPTPSSGSANPSPIHHWRRKSSASAAAVTEARGMDAVPRLYALYTAGAPALTQGVDMSHRHSERDGVRRAGTRAAAQSAPVWGWWRCWPSRPAAVGSAFLFAPRATALLAATRRLRPPAIAARSGIDYGVDEIGQVARSFDHMAKGAACARPGAARKPGQARKAQGSGAYR